MRFIALAIFLTLSSAVFAEVKVIQVDAKVCSPGTYDQPEGPFSIIVFCDDALGTNVSVFLNQPISPIHQSYDLGKRFWQGQEWAYDVISFAWLSNGKLVLSTSAIYGSGSIYLLNPSTKEFRVLHKISGAVIELLSVNGNTIKLRYETKPSDYVYQTINM